MKRMMKPEISARGAILAALTLVGASAQSSTATVAQGLPDKANGQALAAALCSSCHVTGAVGPDTVVPADVPTFTAIANKPGQTAEAIAGRIVLPHPPMPKVQLSRSEIADVATYILSLKKP